MNYALLGDFNGSTHASDLLPAFYNEKADYSKILQCVAKATNWFKKKGVDVFYGYLRKSFTPAYQRVLTDHAIWGNPNKNRGMLEYDWLKADLRPCPDTTRDGKCVWNLMKPAWNIEGPLSDNSGADTQTPTSVCGYWAGIAEAISAIYDKPPKGADGQHNGVLLGHGDSAEVPFTGEL